MIEAVKSTVVAELEKIVGSEFVSTNQADLYIYSYDLTFADSNWPDMVVLPQTLEELKAIISLANKEKVPVTPYVAGGRAYEIGYVGEFTKYAEHCLETFNSLGVS